MATSAVQIERGAHTLVAQHSALSAGFIAHFVARLVNARPNTESRGVVPRMALMVLLYDCDLL